MAGLFAESIMSEREETVEQALIRERTGRTRAAVERTVEDCIAATRAIARAQRCNGDADAKYGTVLARELRTIGELLVTMADLVGKE